MAKEKEGGVSNKETYNFYKECQNCNANNLIHIPKGIKINDHLLNTVKENQICIECGCYVIQYMERI